MDTKQVLDVLKRGMSTELWGRRFYEQAVQRTQCEDGKKVFASLVQEEAQHLDILRGEYAAITQSREWVSVEKAREMAASVAATDIFPDAASADQLIPEGTTDEQALTMAMAFEKRGFDMYTAEAAQAESPEAKAIWDYLAKAEDSHFTFLQKTHEFIVNEGKWFFDDREFPIFYN
ncbi:MAG: ferritin-like domain-containing protein [Anaerolineae bacterium]